MWILKSATYSKFVMRRVGFHLSSLININFGLILESWSLKSASGFSLFLYFGFVTQFEDLVSYMYLLAKGIVYELHVLISFFFWGEHDI
jgi:hypothetical protein